MDNLLVDGYNSNSGALTINNCDFGIYTHNIAAATQSVTMTNVGVGVYGEANTFLKNLTVTNCEINAIRRGIQFTSNPGAGHIYISHNIVSTNDPEGVCIQVEDAMLNQTTSLEILENPSIDCYAGLGGIWVTNFVASIIKWNYVNQFGFVQRDFSGILLTTCNQVEVSCNDVQGSGIDASKASNGIRLDQSGECIVHCNLVNQTNNGFVFNGACGSSDFADNEIQNHETGLRLNNVAIIGNQFNQGNTWVGNYSSGFGAFNLGNSIGNVFEVHTPLSTLLLPQIFHPVNSGQGWFTINPLGDPYDCDNFDECNPDPLNRMLNTNLSLEQSIADGTFTTLDYVPESKSIAKQYLYARLKRDIVLRNQNSSLQGFIRHNKIQV
ncbi:MAG: hypothetical protein IPN99_09310 [Bacteroidetes bacterium]|nr:hypothetical protein [Bacteroidota bacterium]